MMISKKWKAAAAAFLALALVGGSSVAANAAPGDALNPQPNNGSEGGLYIYNGDTEQLISDPNYVFDRAEAIIGSGSATDFQANILGTEANTTLSTNSFAFVASPAKVRGGVAVWEGYAQMGLINGKAKTAYLTPGDMTDTNTPGVEGVFSDVGGTYYLGVAYTKNNGVTVDSAIYRTMTILADGKFTLAPVELEASIPVTPPTEDELVPGLEKADLATTTVDSTTISIDLGAASPFAGQTVNVGAFSTYTDLGQVPLDANGQGTVTATGVSLGQPHKLVVWDPANGDVIAWGGFTLATSTPMFDTDSVALSTTVTASNAFSINANNTTVDLGSAGRNVETAEVALGGFKVIDDRNELRGWNVNVSVADFVGPNGATIAANSLGYKVKPAVVVPGVVVALGADKPAGTGAPGTVASAVAGKSTTAAGADFDLGLTFKSPVDAAVGQYSSTLTLDLVSL